MHNSTTTPSRAQDAPTRTPRRGRRAATTVATTISTAAVLAAAFGAPADAASRYGVWDRVANCESSNDWHINTGNGYYGGLQFSSSTWAAYHGHRYARQANRASRAEQIEVARRVLAAQGPGAWPVCGPRAGLTRASGHATYAPLPREGVRKSPRKSRGHSHAAPHTHAVAHPGHAARHHAARKARRATYRVRSGDTLAAIAHRLRVVGGWRALFRANRHHLSNPNVLHIGQLLVLP